MCAFGLNPLGFDVCGGAGKKPACLHEFGRHDPFARLLGNSRARPNPEADSPGARKGCGVKIGIELAHADVAEKTGQKRPMKLFISCGSRVHTPAVFPSEFAQLPPDVTPLAHPAWREKPRLELLGEKPVALLGGIGIGVPVPDLQQRQKVTLFILKDLVRAIGRILRLKRPLARILNGKAGDDDECLAKGTRTMGGKKHPG